MAPLRKTVSGSAVLDCGSLHSMRLPFRCGPRQAAPSANSSGSSRGARKIALARRPHRCRRPGLLDAMNDAVDDNRQRTPCTLFIRDRREGRLGALQRGDVHRSPHATGTQQDATDHSRTLKLPSIGGQTSCRFRSAAGCREAGPADAETGGAIWPDAGTFHARPLASGSGARPRACSWVRATRTQQTQPGTQQEQDALQNRGAEPVER